MRYIEKHAREPMPKKTSKLAAPSHGDSSARLLAWLATCVSVMSFLFFYQGGEVMLYGDAVAHMNIARRVFDSMTPGPLQLGTVWLPLPHVLMIPFLVSDRMWRTGLGGSIPSMAAYVFAVIGIFRLLRGILMPVDKPSRRPAQAAAWIGAVVFAANPNLIYMQTTAMGESVYLAFFVWAVVYFGEFVRGETKALSKCGLCLVAACLTRYDGWFLAAAMAAAIAVLSLWPANQATPVATRVSRSAVAKFLLLASAAPLFWFAYNGIVYRNPLEFENGPYSAKAIEQRTQTPGNPSHPGAGNLIVAETYFLKSAEINLASNQWVQRLLLVLVCVAFVLALRGSARRSCSPLVFFLLPLPFYALSIAYGGVPLFVPEWWPFSHYNVRYGLQLLPAFAVACALLAYFVGRYDRWTTSRRASIVAVTLVIVAAAYVSVWRATPVCLREAQINMRTRVHFEAQLASLLKLLPPDSTLLMYLGDHVGALERAGIPLRHVINEGNHRVWMQPSDPDGLWERALADPAKYANYVVAFEGDPVWNAIQAAPDRSRLHELIDLHVTGQARAVLYRVQ
jgi:hypothetical protein